ncbi:MAG TPA: TerC family protein [Actinomycetota bacterium]
MVEWYIWAGFIGFIALVLLVDLGIFHREAHRVPFREALAWTGVWVTLAMVFVVVMWVWRGGQVAGEFLAGYLIEWSLSLDNVFVWILIFTHFSVAARYQHRVLFWGIVGAVTLRLGFILGGTALINKFDWIIYVFGGLLLVTAVRFLRERDQKASMEETAILRLVRRFLPMTERYDGQRLIVRNAGKLLATPLLAVLVVVELTDVVFAVDSIPAIFAVTRDAFVVFASNALAILGLRSLYFVLAGAVDRFHYLRPALAALLGFVAVKMLISDWVHIPIALSLTGIAAILGVGALASWISRRGVVDTGT